MPSPTADASLASLLESVHEIEPVIRAHAADAERERRLPDAVADAMRGCGLYRLWRPRTFGGLEVDPMTAFRVLEEVARIDSAAGWNLQLSSAIDAIGPWFPDEGAIESFGGSFFPSRRAVAVDGGYRVTGQTPFVSGAHQAHWFLGLAQIYDGDTPRLGTDGAPMTLLTMCPASDAVIVDSWRTLGMRGNRQPRCRDDRRFRALAPDGVAGSVRKTGQRLLRSFVQIHRLDRDNRIGA